METEQHVDRLEDDGAWLVQASASASVGDLRLSSLAGSAIDTTTGGPGS